VKRKRKAVLDFEVDKLTNSIVNVVSGQSFPTQLFRLNRSDLKFVNKKSGWLFNWRSEFESTECEVYKLVILSNPEVPHGLISLAFKSEHVEMNLLESAPFNRGSHRLFEGVAGNLVAFACSLSFQRGHEGHVAFTAKTKLISHYTETLNAVHIGNGRMIIMPLAAKNLVDQYFKA
jgi:hypothetical protein